MKILISTTENQPPTASLFKQEAVILGCSVDFWYPQRAKLEVKGHNLILPLYTALNYDDSDIEEMKVLSKQNSIQFLNRPDSLFRVRGKDKQIALLNALNIPMIESLIIEGDPALFQNELEKLYLNNRKVVIKPFRGNAGIGVKLYSDMNELNQRVQTDYQANDQRWLIQPWQKNSGETRVLWYSDSPYLSFFKTAGQNFLNNLSQGSELRKLNWNQLSIEIKNMVEKIVDETALNWFAVDFLETEDGPVCMEINTSPGLVHTSRYYERSIAKEILEHEIEKRRRNF